MSSLNHRLLFAYRAAQHGQSPDARVEIHLGQDVLEHLRSFCTVPTPVMASTIWGIAVVSAPESAPRDHISVHTVRDIP